jgi:hypothetical protein
LGANRIFAHDLSGCLAAILRFFWRRIYYVYVFWLSLSISEAAEFRFTSRFLIDAILVDSGLRDYEIYLDRRFSAEIRVLTGFHAYPENRFICKTGTEQHTRQGQLIFKIQEKIGRACMATKSRLIQVGLVCESPKAQQINRRLYS